MKSETRISKSETNPKFKAQMLQTACRTKVPDFGHLDPSALLREVLSRASDFAFRILPSHRYKGWPGTAKRASTVEFTCAVEGIMQNKANFWEREMKAETRKWDRRIKKVLPAVACHRKAVQIPVVSHQVGAYVTTASEPRKALHFEYEGRPSAGNCFPALVEFLHQGDHLANDLRVSLRIRLG